MGEVLITRRGGLDVATTNVLSIFNGDVGATITATLSSKVLTATTDASGYAFFTNLDAGTWTLQATKTGRYVGPKTIEILSTQTVYYIKYPFRTYAYDGSLHSAGASGANCCIDISGGWASPNTISYNETNCAASNSQGYMTTLYNKTAIDLTPFTTFYITFKQHYGDSTVGITTTKNGGTWRVKTTPGTTSTVTKSLDVSNFSNLTGYIKLNGYASHTLYAAWFE